MNTLSSIDIILVILYLVIILFLGLFISRKRTSVKDFFLAGRKMGWVVVGASLFATNIGNDTITGLASLGYNQGIAYANYELFGVLACILLAYVFGPVYFKSGVYTMPEYIHKRYNKVCSRILTVTSIFIYILTKISVVLFTGAIFIKYLTGLDLYSSSLIMVFTSGLYSAVGGQKSIMVTEAVQTVFIIIAGVLLTWYCFDKIGGVKAFVNHENINEDSLKLFRTLNHHEFPWLGVLIGVPIVSTWYHCTDQYMVQKFLSSKNLPRAQSASILSGYLKLLPILLFLIPGIVARELYANIDSKSVYVTMVHNLLPPGIKGIVLIGFVSAMMSSLSSCFNSTSTLFTLDIYKRMYPKASDFKLVNIGRLATFAIVIFSIIWAGIINSFDTSIYLYIQKIVSFISPPIMAVFLMGMIWKRASSNAAIVSLLLGFALAFVKLLCELNDNSSFVSNSMIFNWFAQEPFVYYAAWSFFFSLLLIIVISIFRPNNIQLSNQLFIGGNYEDNNEKKLAKVKRVNAVTACVLIVLVLFIYLIFN